MLQKFRNLFNGHRQKGRRATRHCVVERFTQVLAQLLNSIQLSAAERPRRACLFLVNANRNTQNMFRSTSWLRVLHDYEDVCMPGSRGRVKILEVIQGAGNDSSSRPEARIES